MFLFLCSLCSKQTFVTLPFVLLLLDYWPLGRLFAAWQSVANDPADANDPSQAADRNLPPDSRRIGLGRLLIEKIPFSR